MLGKILHVVVRHLPCGHFANRYPGPRHLWPLSQPVCCGHCCWYDPRFSLHRLDWYSRPQGKPYTPIPILRSRPNMAKLGMRAIATSRYSFGFYGAKICSILNVIIGGGFAVVNVVVVGQILSAVSGYTMTISVGCVIIAIISYLVSVFGFAIIHTYEKYSWIMSVILMIILMAEVGDKMDASIPGEDGNSGLAFAGSFLSFMAINFSSASGWCSIASDYYCNYPADTKPWKVATMTVLGISIPTIFVTVIGACLGNVAVSNAAANPILADAYTNHGLGGLLLESYHPLNFSKFCLVSPHLHSRG